MRPALRGLQVLSRAPERRQAARPGDGATALDHERWSNPLLFREDHDRTGLTCLVGVGVIAVVSAATGSLLLLLAGLAIWAVLGLTGMVALLGDRLRRPGRGHVPQRCENRDQRPFATRCPACGESLSATTAT